MRKLTKKFDGIEKTFEELKDYVEMKTLSPFMEVATTAAAVVTEEDNVFFGINIKADCGLGFCSERNAMSSMLTVGETKIKYILCVDRTLSLRLPCGACREFIAQISPDNLEAEIVTCVSPLKTTKLKELLPDWWGQDKIKRRNKK